MPSRPPPRSWRTPAAARTGRSPRSRRGRSGRRCPGAVRARSRSARGERVTGRDLGRRHEGEHAREDEERRRVEEEENGEARRVRGRRDQPAGDASEAEAEIPRHPLEREGPVAACGRPARRGAPTGSARSPRSRGPRRRPRRRPARAPRPAGRGRSRSPGGTSAAARVARPPILSTTMPTRAGEADPLPSWPGRVRPSGARTRARCAGR